MLHPPHEYSTVCFPILSTLLNQLRQCTSIQTDPELKGGGVPLGSRRWCSGPIQQKKRPDLGLACHVEPDRPNSCCCIGQECAVPKITCDVSDRKPAPTCQEKKFLEFFLSSRPEHNQKPPTDTANRHCAFIPTRRKIAVWPQGAQSTAPLARGRSTLGFE